MHTHNEDAIRDRAYALWLEAGSPDGNDWQFWHDAERELAAGALDMPETADNDTMQEQPAGQTAH